ncbi:BTB domain-containing protein [Mycena chlorophos]|uniref:BTB domain-containing protein n=1 Tax=Mycena chlorophos TaxID=658473 RepID=A0A8H6W3G5_MYCCL|nr:BTB domain-containing protein [Mycena chlorophos]
MSTLQSLQRFDEYYLTGGDLYCIAENRIFRVHRYFFERESQYFRAQLAQPVTPGAQRLGTGEDNAILLDGVRSQAFAKLLFIFYNPRYSIYELVVDDWATILELADKWGFAEVKNLCVRQLEALEMLDVDRIVLYHDNHVDERLLVPRYVALCDRPELLTVDEGLRLGMATVIALTRARECARNGASSGLRSPSPPSMTEKEMREIVLDHFHIDMKSDSDPLKTEGEPTNTTFTSATTTGPIANGNGIPPVPPKPQGAAGATKPTGPTVKTDDLSLFPGQKLESDGKPDSGTPAGDKTSRGDPLGAGANAQSNSRPNTPTTNGTGNTKKNKKAGKEPKE